jgi:hypothetical protein
MGIRLVHLPVGTPTAARLGGQARVENAPHEQAAGRHAALV